MSLHNLDSLRVFGMEASASPPPQPLPSLGEPYLVSCVLCPEPGLVPASMMSAHLLREHQGMAFQSDACKVRDRVDAKYLGELHNTLF